MLHFVPLEAVQVTDPFWAAEQRLVHDVVLPYQWEILNDRVPDAEPSYCIRNFRIAAGQETGSHGGAVFQDTDLYKWLEAVAYWLMLEKDEALEALADGAIDLIAAAQQPDGYLDTYYIIEAPRKKWSNLMEGHELYCAGHLMEAAVAYAQATGKQKLLDVAQRLADCIQTVFGEKGIKHGGYPGHPEVELALVKLTQATGCSRYLELAQYFVDARGADEGAWFLREQQQPGHTFLWPEMEKFGTRYFQAHQPVRLQRQAAGHAVRAMYLYSAMTDLALLQKDEGLAQACRALYQNVTRRQMYVTGAIGSASFGERFTTDYDLPNDTVYGETCASIGLMMFSRRMFLLDKDVSVFDTWQRALENAVLAGMGKDGRHFFYVNPLAVNPTFVRHSPTLEHVKVVRQKWFGVACCPPNLARTLTALGGSLYAMEQGKLYVLAHIGSSFRHEGISCTMTRRDEECTLTVEAPPMDIYLRKPEGWQLSGDGVLHHPGGRVVYRYRLTPLLRYLRANAPLAADGGKVCVVRGQQVYCLEQADNGQDLNALYLDTTVPPQEFPMDFLPPNMTALRCRGWRRKPTEQLYSDRPPAYEPAVLTFIPYSQWNNRGEGEMQVWVNEANPVHI